MGMHNLFYRQKKKTCMPSKLEVVLVPPQSRVKTKSTHQKYLKHLVTSLQKKWTYVAKEDIIEIELSAPAEAKDVNLDDVGCWPSTMTDEVRTLLVRRGSDSVQHIDSKFADVVRSGTSTKGGTRKLTREWFYKPLSNGEKVLRTWMVYSPLKQSSYCFCCKLFGNSGSNFASEEGFNKCWKLNLEMEGVGSSPEP